jgi:queuosine precursor transporter
MSRLARLSRRQYQALGVAAFAGYVLSVLLANVLTSRFGLVPAGFGLLVTAGTYTAGLALTLRDVLQRVSGYLSTVVSAMVLAGVLSYWLADPRIATASLVAFLVSEALDLAVYTPLQDRSWRAAVLASNVIGALADTLLFLTIAGFPVTAASVGGQLLVKVGWMTLGVLALGEVVRRAVRRNALDPAGA